MLARAFTLVSEQKAVFRKENVRIIKIYASVVKWI